MGNRNGGRGRVCAVVAVLFWAQAVSGAPLALSCKAAEARMEPQATALCEAIASVLAETDPARGIVRDGAGSGSGEAIEVTVLEAGKRSLTARLSWHSGGASGHSPPLSLAVSDALLAPHIYRQLAAALLSESDWPE